MSETTPDGPVLPAPVFRKTKQGKWAVMGPVVTLQAALDTAEGRVEVSKKAGGTSSFTVVSLGRPFDVDGIAMCYGYDDVTQSPDGGGSRPSTGHRSSMASPPSEPSVAAPPSTPPAPPRDEYEPLPEFQGGPEDEWQESF